MLPAGSLVSALVIGDVSVMPVQEEVPVLVPKLAHT